MTTSSHDGRRPILVARIYHPDGTSSQITLPSSSGSNNTARLLAGPVNDDVMKVLPEAVRLVRRIVPWASVVLAPKVLQVHDPIAGFPTVWLEGLTCNEVGGLAHKAGKTIFVSMNSTPSGLLETICHEAWHMIEDRLSEEWRQLISAQLVVPAWTNADEYWSDPEECRARAFQAWCRRLVEGMTGPMFVRGHMEIDEIFSDVWDGRLGQVLTIGERIAE